MPIFSKDKEIVELNFRERAIVAVYKGAKLVWDAARSCFSKGFWVNDYPWDNMEGWNNNSK